jgi:hypothetical protein
MPISISCTGCGKALTIKDELVGKRIKCPQCGATFTSNEAIAQARSKQSGERTGKGVHVSPGVIMFVSLVVLVVGSLAFYKFVPGRVQDKWSKLRPVAEQQVEDVVNRALEADMSQQGEYNPNSSRTTPHMINVTFIFSMLAMSMPEKVGFAGSTSEGAMFGRYFTQTGEIEADIDVGGRGVGGAVLTRGKRSIHVTGRVKNGNLSVEIDGKPAVIDFSRTLPKRR